MSNGLDRNYCFSQTHIEEATGLGFAKEKKLIDF